MLADKGYFDEWKMSGQALFWRGWNPIFEGVWSGHESGGSGGGASVQIAFKGGIWKYYEMG